MGGMTCLLLLLWVGVTASTVVDLQRRIMGGANCNKMERLYHVKLTDKNNGFICGGSLINESWILTAAHCWEMNMRAIVGVHPRQRTPVPSVEITEPPQVFRDRNICHDIMLLKLPQRVTNIKPVDLPDCSIRPNQFRIAGHTISNINQMGQRRTRPVNDLQCADIPRVDCPWDQRPPRHHNPKAHEHRICGRGNNVDACCGDSGGGAVYNDMIYGVISTGGVKPFVHPVQFMNVCAYRDWIEKTIATKL